MRRVLLALERLAVDLAALADLAGNRLARGGRASVLAASAADSRSGMRSERQIGQIRWLVRHRACWSRPMARPGHPANHCTREGRNPCRRAEGQPRIQIARRHLPAQAGTRAAGAMTRRSGRPACAGVTRMSDRGSAAMHLLAGFDHVLEGAKARCKARCTSTAMLPGRCWFFHHPHMRLGDLRPRGTLRDMQGSMRRSTTSLFAWLACSRWAKCEPCTRF